MEDNKAPISCGTGPGFFGSLTIAFIVLRLCRVIAWPWIWVLAPIWIPLAIVAIVCFIAAALS